jgi:protoporphyrin/coproporphyrin ferrochelatase
MSTNQIDAILLVSFGGPEGPDDVIPFLENVTRGRNVPRERLLQVAKHYELFGGVSPINSENRKLIAALSDELAANNINLPIYWGNRNWHPLLKDTVSKMRDDGIKHAIAFVTAAYSSYSSCRQYRENIAAAQVSVGEDAPQIDKLRVFYNHPLFIEANADNVSRALDQLPESRRSAARLLFTAHSIPLAMAENCEYENQLRETSRLVAKAVDHPRHELVFQSRSGSPTQPWLGPDICERLRELKEQSVTDVIVAPIGFVSDHMEVIYDLDVQAQQVAREGGVNMVRAKTAGTHPQFVKMIRLLIEERLNPLAERLSVGGHEASPDVCDIGCCLKE